MWIANDSGLSLQSLTRVGSPIGSAGLDVGTHLQALRFSLRALAGFHGGFRLVHGRFSLVEQIGTVGISDMALPGLAPLVLGSARLDVRSHLQALVRRL